MSNILNSFENLELINFDSELWETQTPLVGDFVINNSPTNIGETSFTCNANILHIGDYEIITRGFVYKKAVSGNPVLGVDLEVHDSSSSFPTGIYSKDLSNLNVNVAYQIRAYIINSNNEITYSNTIEQTIIVNGIWATGGIVTYDGNYKIHTFTESDDFIVTSAGNIEVLVVAGGGAGGARHGGGGAGGGVVYHSNLSITQQTYSVSVGTGGIPDPNHFTVGGNGLNSSFDNIIALGGGGGGSYTAPVPTGGGSGGGGGGGQNTIRGIANQENSGGGSGYGFNGGDGGSSTGGGGGGGASTTGVTATADIGGDGGYGFSSSISGTTITYGGGGGGGGGIGGGLGHDGGGNGSASSGVTNGENCRGGGGGGTRSINQNECGAFGGSGIVIIKYLDIFPKVSIGQITNNNSITLTANAEVIDTGYDTISEYGFIVTKVSDSSITTFSDTGSFSTGSYSKLISNLEYSGIYFLKAFATNSIGTSYSDSIEFIANKNVVSELKNYSLEDGYIIYKFYINNTIQFYQSKTVEINAWGAGGAGGTPGGWFYGAAGGAGSSVNANISIPATTHNIIIGGAGKVNSTVSSNGGGGIASADNYDNRYSGGGGGYSGIFSGTVSQANALLIAAGGGGGGSSRTGTGNIGGGGDQDGVSAYDSKTGYRGRAATISAAGADASSDGANLSGEQSALQGGHSRTHSYGGGGGGGYFGGSGGGYSKSNTMGGGGGGSSYVNTNYATSYNILPGNYSTPGDSTNSLRESVYGNSGAASSDGSDGLIVLKYYIEEGVILYPEVFVSTNSIEVLNDNYGPIAYGNSNLSISKAVFYTVLTVPGKANISKAVFYTVLGPDSSIAQVSKIVGYAVLSPPGIINVSKIIGYAVLGPAGFELGPGNLNINGADINFVYNNMGLGSGNLVITGTDINFTITENIPTSSSDPMILIF